MTFKKIKVNEVIHDGSDDNFYGLHHINIDSENTIEFHSHKLNSLIKLETQLTKKEFDFLIDSIPDKIVRQNTIPEFSCYKNSQGLHVHYLETAYHLAIIALGEKQPMRYQIILEGLFEKI